MVVLVLCETVRAY